MADDAWAGWSPCADDEPDTFFSIFSPSYSRAEGPGRARVAVDTVPLHRNGLGALHGGFIAAVADHVGFAALRVLGRPEQRSGLTIDLQVQYLNIGRVGPPLIADVEILRETGRLFFVRMLFRQEDTPVAAASATLRKVSETKA